MKTTTTQPHKFPYKWTLKDAIFTKDKGKVFSCFACGGGSTMGYKLAGFDVIGCNEIDPKMMDAYKANHNPKYAFLEPIQDFKLRKDLPEELYNLDILDGSPPCSSFSLLGTREKDWGKEKKFREGQSMQIMDTLFFDFIDLAKELQPKVVIAENVSDILKGNAKDYVIKIKTDFDEAGYYCQHFLLDGSNMGLPQRRKRVFFICLRKDLAKKLLNQVDLFDIQPKLKMVFKEPRITFGEVYEPYTDRPVTGSILRSLEESKPGETDLRYACERLTGKKNLFAYKLLDKETIPTTITAGSANNIYAPEKRYINFSEILSIGSFPTDYNFTTNKPVYLVGMSVPPVMTAQIASNIYDQWLSKI